MSAPDRVRATDPDVAGARDRVRAGDLRGERLCAWLAARPPAGRDAAFEQLLGLEPSPWQDPIGEDRMGYLPSAIAPVVRAVLDVPVTADDVFVDLGSGLGKVVMAVHLLTGARCRGVEVQPDLAVRARGHAEALDLGRVSFDASDASEASLGDATVVFLYIPFTGKVLSCVLERLRAVAQRRQLVVCALGFDLRGHDWLAPRPTDEFWLSIYDTRIEGAKPRPPVRPALAREPAETIARGL